MTHIKSITAVWIAMVVLFGETIISVRLFARFHSDGGAWPFIITIFLFVDLLYALYMVWLVKAGRASKLLVVVLTVLMSMLLFVFNNFWLMFGGRTADAVKQYWSIGEILGSGLSPYSFYLFFMFAATIIGKFEKIPRG